MARILIGPRRTKFSHEFASKSGMTVPKADVIESRVAATGEGRSQRIWQLLPLCGHFSVALVVARRVLATERHGGRPSGAGVIVISDGRAVHLTGRFTAVTQKIENQTHDND